MIFQHPTFNKKVKQTCDHVKEERRKAMAAQKTACNAALVTWLKQLEGHSAACEDEEDGGASDVANGDEDEGDNAAASLVD